MPEPFRYLAVKNWDKYQAGTRGKWIKDYVDRESDPDYAKLTMFQRALLDGICRLRGRLGKNLPNDSTHIARALLVCATERPRIGNAIDTLIERGFLILTNQQDGSIEERRKEESRGDVVPIGEPAEKPKPEAFTPEDLAPTVLTQIGIGLTAGTAKAAIEAIRVKAKQPDWDAQKASLHIIERAHAYRASPVFKANGTRFKSWEKWLIEGCYDEPPESWNGNGKEHVTKQGKTIDRGYVPLTKT